MQWYRLVWMFTLTLTVACSGGGGDNDNRPSSNANLSSLLVEDAVLSPAFSNGTTEYTADVTGGTTTTRITGFTTDSRARLTIDGEPATSGTPSDPISLPVGDTSADVVVTAEDGSRKTYSVRIIRPVPNNDATLATFVLTAGPLLQPFDPSLTNYDAAVGYLATTTRVLATPTDPLADSLRVNGELSEFGAPSEIVPLSVGVAAGAVSAEVIAEDALTSRSYEVDVSRAEFNTVDQEAYLKATNTDSGDRFATSLALTDELLLIGAPAEQSLATTVDGDQSDNSGNAVGAAYLYEMAGGVWTPSHYLKAGNGNNGDRFGAASASMAGLLAVGAPGEQSRSSDPVDNSGNAVGAVYLFDPDVAGAPEQIAYLKASNPDNGDGFGSAIVANGDRVLIGAPFEASDASGVNGDDGNNSLANAGAAYLFEPNESGSYAQHSYLKASNPTSGTDNQFGNAVAISGTTIAVAAWREDSAATGVNGEENDTSAPNSGAVYLFEAEVDGDWSQAAYLKASNTGQDHNFGTAIALDGDTLVVGAPGENTTEQGSGAVYIFVRDDSGDWTQEALLKSVVVGLDDAFGSQVVLVGDLLAVGAPGERSDAMGINGADINENASGAGAVYLFERTALGTWQQIAYIKASNTDAGDAFGTSLALEGDILIIGAPEEQSAATGVDGDQDDNTRTAAGAGFVIR